MRLTIKTLIAINFFNND